MFCFGGRRANLELQLPFIYDILERHPDVEYHIWDLARTREDSAFIRTLGGHNERVIVWDQFSGGSAPWEHFNSVYRFYAHERYEECTFVKLDDDVVFIETASFGQFLDLIPADPTRIFSAKVINNGACGVHFPEVKQWLRTQRYPLLDVHLHPSYAQKCHELFLAHPNAWLSEDIRLIPTDDWLSINLIGYSYRRACKIARLLGSPSPRRVAGRIFLKPHAKLGDEGLVNTLPRTIVEGFTAAHLTFGPQEKRMSAQKWDELRAQYALIGKDYLS